MTTVRVIDAPSNLGLRPPAPGTTPGTAGAPEALRSAGLLPGLEAVVSVVDGGVVPAPPYDHAEWAREDPGVRHAAQLAQYARALADVLGAAFDDGELPLVLGGDCSVLLGSALALRRRTADRGLRTGLVFVDGHSDFRHPGNTDVAGPVGAAAGEDLALVTGRGQAGLADLDGLGPLFSDDDVVVLGPRPGEPDLAELASVGIPVRTSAQVRADGGRPAASWAASHVSAPGGFWLHLDVDVLDPSVLSAVDSPDPDGLMPDDLVDLLVGLLSTGRCMGVEVTVFDPTQDVDGAQARLLVDVLSRAFAGGIVTP